MGLFSKHFQQATDYFDFASAAIVRNDPLLSNIPKYLIRKPGPPGPPTMPDQTSVLQSQQLQESKDAALQYGRAATVLTGTGTAGAGTTDDKLGP